MKPALIRKRDFNWKDIGLFALWLLGHYVLMFIYTAFVFLIKFAINGEFFSFDTSTWIIFYSLIIGPIVSWVFHIWYSERGKPFVRLAMWLNTLLMFILVIIAAFI